MRVSVLKGYVCRRAWPVLAALFVYVSLAADAGAQGSAATDRAALLALYEASGGPSWRVRTNWLSGEPIGDWYGVVTDDGGRVRELHLQDNGLTGTLPPEIGNLSRLSHVHFWSNALTGPIPPAFWSLPLDLVALTGNQVTGTLPPEVGDLADLRWVDLGYTAMTGPLPASMTNLSLEYLRITGSYLCAPADDVFQAWLKTIGEFDGETCMPETGSVGTDRAALVALYHSSDGANWRNNTNWLSARPLGEWYGVTTDGTGRVAELDLGWGGLTGTLPPEIGNLSRLRELHFYDNFDLTGPLPPEVGNRRRLESLGLTSTDIYGLLPASVCNLSNLVYLGLSWSEMRGPLPQCLTNLSELDSFGTWETFLCTPADAAFQTWLEGLSDTHGIHTCAPATLAVAPDEISLRGAVAQSIAVAQTGGGDPVMWTAAGTQPWLRVTPAAGMGTGRVIVSTDSVMFPAGGGAATAAVMVTADGAWVRVPVTVVREAAAAELSLPAIEPTGSRRLDGYAETGPPSGRRAPARTERRATDRLPDCDPLQYRMTLETDDTPAGDRAALTALHNATAGDNWWRNTHWLSDRPLGEWYGVTTDTGGRVTALELSDNRLTGAVPETLASLTRLELLDLSRNALTGSIPAALGDLAGLRQLNLSFNALTGAIPPGLGDLSNLELLNLQNNEFRTPIPPALGNLNKLEVLNFDFALVTGPIPPALGNLSNLKYLDLADNYSLTGAIPPALGNLTSLEFLSLGGNRLEGSIPAELGRLTNLRELRLQNNLLSGEIPPEFGNLLNLGVLALHNNSLTGMIPPELGRLSLLFYLGLHENALTGPMPASLGGTSLHWLYLHQNDLTGAIPGELGELDSLRFLQLQDNALSGSIPSALGELDNLEVLDLRNNALAGPIPATLGQSSTLEVLDLSDNELTGPIPNDLGDLSNLWWLDLRENALTGPIPSALGNLSELVWLDLAWNRLTGPIPPELGALERLTKLSLWRNDLTGSIPRGLGALSNLEQLYLGENALTGSIPARVGELANLRQLYLAGNGLSGRIPEALGELASLDVLHLRENALTGSLPIGLGSLSNLTWLDVAANALTGTLPSALGNIATLRALSLSGNRLTGVLPGELTALSELDYLWIDETGLCAPTDASFQEWLATIEDFFGSMCPQVPASFSIPDRGGQSTTISGTGETLRVGYGRIRAEAGSTTPAGVAIFQFRNSQGVLISEAGVPAAEPVREGRIFVEVNGPVNTGLAIANPNDMPAIIRFYFTDTTGTRFPSGSFELPGYEQTAAFLNQPPFNSGSPVLGTFTFESSAPIAVTALRGLSNEAGEFLMTTLPVAPLSPPASGTVYFPHFADGNGWATQVIFVNPTESTITGTVGFLGPGSGTVPASPVVLALDDGRTGASFDYSIPPRSAQRFTTSNPSGEVSSGSVRATPSSGNAAPSGLVVFSYAQDGKTVSEAGVPALPKGTAFRAYVEASGTPGQAGSIRSGLAITNTAATSNTVTLEVTRLDGSLAVPPATLALPPSGQVARFLDEIFSLPDNFSGVLRVTSTADVAMVALRLRVNENGELKMTTTSPSNEMDPSTSEDRFFAHLADSAGWSTQFILFSGTAGQTSSGTLSLTDASGKPLERSP